MNTMKGAAAPDDLEDRELDAVVGGVRSQRDGGDSGGTCGSDDDDDFEVPDSIIWDYDGGNEIS